MGETPQWVDERGVQVRGGGAPTSIAAARRIRQRAGGPALLAMGAALLLAACAPTPVRVLPAPQPTVAPPELVLAADTSSAADATADAAADAAAERMIVELVRAERLGASQRNASLLSSLWAEDARIVETRGTPNPTDDYTWQGRAAILDRYQVAVFQSPPQPYEDEALPGPELEGERASLSTGADAWSFVRRDGRWWIAELVIDPAPGTP